MGNSSSRMDKFYGNYEKSFERLEADVQRLKVRSDARSQRQAHLSRWTGAAVVLTFAVSVGVIHQVQSQPHGTYSYQQHFSRIGTAVALPAVAVAMHWVLLLIMGWVEGRDMKKLKALEAAKRSMIKELKDMSRFDKIKSLIDKFDPDTRGPLQSRGPMQQDPMRQEQRPKQQQQHGGQVPGLLMKGSGQVAGAAALAVAGAGKAIMPLLDKVATSLISENPMLLEDLRRAQIQLNEAEMRMAHAVQEGFAVKEENLGLKQHLVELEKQLGLPPSYRVEVLQEQLQQHQEQQQQLPWLVQKCIQAGSMAQPAQMSTSNVSTAGGDVDVAASSDGHLMAGLEAGDWSQVLPTATGGPHTPVSATGDRVGEMPTSHAGGKDLSATPLEGAAR